MFGTSRIKLVLLAIGLFLLNACASDAQVASEEEQGEHIAQVQSALTGTRVPVFELYSAGSTDHYYTIDPAIRDLVIGYGWAYLGVPFYLESAPASGTAPFRRFYKNSPQTDHFYTTVSYEVDYVLAAGWADEGTTGHIYTWQTPGSTPLYRLNRWVPTGDLDHQYTTSAARVSSLQSQGWTLDGNAGYVFAGPEPAGAPAEQNDALTVTVYSLSSRIDVTNNRTGVTHAYPGLVQCGSITTILQDDLNGDPGREVVISTPCNRHYIIDDAKQRVTEWRSSVTPGTPPGGCLGSTPSPAALRQSVILADPDQGHAGKELVVISKWGWQQTGGGVCGGFAKVVGSSFLEVVRPSAVSTVTTTTTTAIASVDHNLSFGPVPWDQMFDPSFLGAGNFDGWGGEDIALVQGYNLVERKGIAPAVSVWTGNAGGYSWLRSGLFTSPETTLMLSGDTNNVTGDEIVATQKNTWTTDPKLLGEEPKQIVVWSPLTNTSRVYNVNANKVKDSFKNRDGVAGNEICYRIKVNVVAGCLPDSEAPWCKTQYLGYMIVDRTGQIISNPDCR